MGGPTSGSGVSPMPPPERVQYCSDDESGGVTDCITGTKNASVQLVPWQQSPANAECGMQEASAHSGCPIMAGMSMCEV